MNPPQIGCIGSGWSHVWSTTLYKKPSFFEWAYEQELDTTFFVDNKIQQGIRSRCPNKFFWLVESRDVIPNAIDFVKRNHKLVSENCKFLFTHCRDIVELEPNFLFLPSHGTWISAPAMCGKSKIVSLISSNKNWLAGHQHRLGLVKRFQDSCDVFGRGIRDFDRKEDVLCPYMFNICIENASYDGYFSEKLLDCFCTGTIPIYYGDPTIGRCFDERGIIKLTDDFDINSLTKELYASMLPYAEINLALAKEYNVIEDWLWSYINE